MPRVLFVCTANICRSPMAAALFQRQLAARSGDGQAGQWSVGSAGTWATDGLPASRGSAVAMAERGLDLSAHRSHALTEDDLRQADLVLVMTAGHREGILAEFPFARDRVELISQMTGRTYDISDPYGGPQEGYQACADELESLIAAGFDQMVGRAAERAASRDQAASH